MTECLAAQLVGRGTKLRAAIFYPSGGMLDTGIWTTKRNRPAELARQTLPQLGIEVTAADTSDETAVAAAVRANTKLLWIVTPANPILRLSDIQMLAELAHGAGARLAVDSTFATPIATRPIELLTDFVVH